MAGTVHITYIFDPLCGWCYGASATLQKLAARPDIAISPAPSGLFAGDGARPMDEGFASYAWANDQRIAALTGQPFSQVYRDKVLGDRTRPLDSGPATLALTAVALSAPDQELHALAAIQKIRYVEGGDVTDTAVLARVLRGLGLHEAADRLAAPDGALLAANAGRVGAARDEMRRFGGNGVPALIAGAGGSRRMMPTGVLFGSVDALIDMLAAA